METRVMSGIQPTGDIHIGNYLGAIKQWVEMTEQYRCFYVIVDYHAITIEYDVASFQENILDAAMANIRSHILKARADLQYKNIGTAKNELEHISDTFDKVKTTASDENKKVIEELQGILKKAQAALDNDLPAAVNRIDLLWHEMGTLLRDA